MVRFSPSVALTPATAALLSVGFACSKATADVTFTSATRTITAIASNSPFGAPPADVSTDSVTGFGAYNHAVDHQTPSIDQPPGTFDVGHAEQHSFIGTSSASFSGVVSGEDNAVSSGSGQGTGRSQLILGFTLTSSTAWSFLFTSAVGLGVGNSTFASFQLQNAASTPIVAFDPLSTASPQTGVLEAGTYTLILDAMAGHAFTGTGSAQLTYNWAFNVPSPASGSLFVLAPLAMGRRRR